MGAVRFGRQDFPRSRGVGGNLRLQLVKASEFTLGADEVDERDAQVPPIEVAVDVEKMRFEAPLARYFSSTIHSIGSPWQSQPGT